MEKSDYIRTDLERTNPNRFEHSLLMNFLVVGHAINANAERCKERMKPYKEWWRDVRLIYTLLEKVSTQMLSTIPIKRLFYYRTLAQQGKVSVDIEGPVNNHNLVLVDAKALEPLAETVVKNECALCIKSGKEIKKCPVREALMTIVPPDEIHKGEHSMCEYAEHAILLNKEE